MCINGENIEFHWSSQGNFFKKLQKCENIVIDKATVKLTTNTCNLFRNIAAERVDKHVARFTIHVQTCIETNKGCCKLSKY